MWRMLSTNSLRSFSVFGRNLPSLVSLTVSQQRALTLSLCSKSTSGSRSMDLSDMRKKYKAEEEVRSIQKA